MRVTRVPVRPDPVRPVRPLTSFVGARTVRIRRMTTGVCASAVPIMCASRASATIPVAKAPLTVISAAVRPFRELPTVTGADRPSSSLARTAAAMRAVLASSTDARALAIWSEAMIGPSLAGMAGVTGVTGMAGRDDPRDRRPEPVGHPDQERGCRGG